jgi:chromatin assembly factor 1 subunit B
LYAVATMDSIAIHDTQQAGPICLLTKLHYDEFTDMSWSVFSSTFAFAGRAYACAIGHLMASV